MAKYNITRLLETTPLLATQAGEQLKGAVNYLSELAENVSRILRNGITFADNVACEIRTVGLKHDTDTVIGAAKPVTGIIPTRVISQRALDSFAWFYDAQSRLVVRATFGGAPADSQNVTLVLLF